MNCEVCRIVFEMLTVVKTTNFMFYLPKKAYVKLKCFQRVRCFIVSHFFLRIFEVRRTKYSISTAQELLNKTGTTNNKL